MAQENLAGVRTVKAFAREKYEITKFLSHNKRYYEFQNQHANKADCAPDIINIIFYTGHQLACVGIVKIVDRHYWYAYLFAIICLLLQVGLDMLAPQVTRQIVELSK